MLASGADSGTPMVTADEEELVLTGSRLTAATRPRLCAPVSDVRADADADVPARDQRTLTLAGEIDVTTAETVRDSATRCLRDEPDVLVVDLHEADFCDSTGVRVLRWVLRRATLAGATVCVIPPREQFRRMLAVLGADDLLAVIAAAGAARACWPTASV